MKLTIISPIQNSNHEIVWIEAETPTGNYVIQPGHAETTLILLKNQPLTFCLKNGKQELLTPTHESIMQITPTKISILLNE